MTVTIEQMSSGHYRVCSAHHTLRLRPMRSGRSWGMFYYEDSGNDDAVVMELRTEKEILAHALHAALMLP